MLECLCVGLGGFIGSVCRYLIGCLAIETASGFPVKTFAINIIGAFVLGIVSEYAVLNPAVPRQIILLLQVGLCGGFTTFSTFSSEALKLLSSGRAGTALFYMATSMTLGLLAVYGGQCVSRMG